MLAALFIIPPELPAAIQASKIGEPEQSRNVEEPSTISKPIELSEREETGSEFLDVKIAVPTGEDATLSGDSILTRVHDDKSPYDLNGKIPFNPSPTRAVWLSALFPGLGQIYNRRYWKLPIVVGGFMGLGYGTAWNNNQLRDYTQGYRDVMDNDPATNSYMNFFPSTTSEESLDKTWLSATLKSRRDYYRRNRDICIICMAALYLLCMLDAYVDATLIHFDISDNLSLDVSPTVVADKNPVSAGPTNNSFGLNWAFTF